jgi:hypothetical protein
LAADDVITGRPSWRDWAWVLACASLSSIWIVTADWQLSATFDEPVYLSAGLQRWRSGGFGQLKAMGTMPLPVDVCTLPLYLAEKISGRRIDLENEMARWLPIARAGALVFWWVLLVYGWRLGRLLAGPWAGRIAVGVLATEPTFLAHAGLATTDVASAACLLGLAFHYRVALLRSGWRSWIAPVGWTAASLLAKASAVVYVPIIVIAAECDRLREPGGRPILSRFSGLVPRISIVAGLGFIVAAIYTARPAGLVQAIAFQIQHNRAGHGGTFLFGRWSDVPLWYYFPALLTIKLPWPAIATPLVIVILRPRALTNWPLAVAAAMLLVSLTCHIQIGVRYLLPMVAFAIVGLAAAGIVAWEQSVGWRRSAAAAFAATGASVMLFTAVTAWPNGLSFSNGLWGPAVRGYLLASDSNYDWGQGLYELAAWQRTNDAGTVDVAYFGMDPTLKRLNMRPIDLPAVSLDDGPPRRLAVSTTLFVLGPYDRVPAIRRLKALTPSACTTTFLIYDLPVTGSPPPTATAARPR